MKILRDNRGVPLSVQMTPAEFRGQSASYRSTPGGSPHLLVWCPARGRAEVPVHFAGTTLSVVPDSAPVPATAVDDGFELFVA